MYRKYCIISYTHILQVKHTTLGGPAVALAKYLGDKAYCIWQPIPVGKRMWVYYFYKIRDIFLVLTRFRVCHTCVSVESINALLGALGRKLGVFQKVIYWNYDYSPNRGKLWLFLDRLAIKLADEVWVLKERGIKGSKVVPVGCWYDEIKRVSPKEQKGFVYIGLLED